MLTNMHDTLTDGDIQGKRAPLSKVVARIDMGPEGAKLSYTFPWGDRDRLDQVLESRSFLVCFRVRI